MDRTTGITGTNSEIKTIDIYQYFGSLSASE